MRNRRSDDAQAWAMDAPEQGGEPCTPEPAAREGERAQGAKWPPKAPLPQVGGADDGPDSGHEQVCQSFFMVEPGALLVLPEYGGGNRVVHIHKRCVLFCAEADDGTMLTPEYQALNRYADAECRGAGGLISVSMGGREQVPRPPQMQDFPPQGWPPKR